jgi:2-C-methyl-D-erythritol 2,4-cyclodiphosphate synthase/2-C-methyl-D-erythritol 4-phosphate cytidylyltransferase
MRYWLVMPAAGSGSRFGEATPKQYARLAGSTVIEWALTPFLEDDRCRGIIVALAAADLWWPQVAARLGAAAGARPPGAARAAVSVAAGGVQRSLSVRSALTALQGRAQDEDWVLVHDAARPCLRAEDLDRLLTQLDTHALGGLLSTPAPDTLKRALPAPGADSAVEQTVDRAGLYRALTPQMFRYGRLSKALDAAHAAGRFPTDEAQALEWLGERPQLVAGQPDNLKVTTAADLRLAEAVLRARKSPRNAQDRLMRIGSGLDVHAFGAGDFIMLGGVRIAHSRGVVAHSDGDVVLHALCDALLGACGLGDIGQHFPDSDPQWRGADSRRFVSHAVGLLRERGLTVANADLTVLAQSPRIAPHRDAMRSCIAGLLGVEAARVNIKATTTEGLGFLGRTEGIAAQAVVLLAEG